MTLPNYRARRARGKFRTARSVALMGQVLLWFLMPAVDGDARTAAAEHHLAAAEEPHLPPTPTPVGPLHRSENGRIETIDPTTKSGTGRRVCARATICVGADQAYRTLSAALAVAHDGAIIEVAGGVYHESVKIAQRNITVRGVAGRPHFDCTGLKLIEDKSCLLLAGNGATLENLEIGGAVLPDDLGANGACVRNENNVSFTLRRILCHGSQDGVLSDGGAIVVENSEFFDNGWTGQTHNVYFGGDCTVTVRGSTFRDARIGHEFKSRCRKTEISDSTFRSTKGSRDLDIPDGGQTLVYRSTLLKIRGTENAEIVGFAAESCKHPGDLLLKDVHIINSEPLADVRNFDKCAGHAIIFDDVTVEGLPLREFGYIIKR